MRLADVANFIGRRVITSERPLVVCPPGLLEPGDPPNIVVATKVRTGTHLLIDSILNNFPAYRRRPLYVSLDNLLRDEATAADNARRLIQCGGYVVKTHFPQVFERAAYRDPLVRKIAENSIIISTARSQTESLRSIKNWGELPAILENQSAFGHSVERFDSFWSQYDKLIVPFLDLVDRSAYPSVIKEIANHIGQEHGQVLVAPRPKSSRFSIYIDKALTRLFAQKAPVINTTFRIG